MVGDPNKACFYLLCLKAVANEDTLLRKHCCGNIVAHDVSLCAQTGKHLLRTQNVSEQSRKHFCVPDTKFVSATNVARAGKRGNICVGNNVSSFASTFIITVFYALGLHLMKEPILVKAEIACT